MLILLILIVIICCCKSRKQRYSPDKLVHAVHEPDVKRKPNSLNPSDSNTEHSQTRPVKSDLLSPPNKYETNVPPPIETYSGGIVSSESRTLEEKGDYVTVTSAKNEVYFSTFKPTGHEYDDITKKPAQPPVVKVQLQAKREHENDDTDSKKQTQPVVPPLPPMNVRPNESEATFKPTEPEYDDIRSDKPMWPVVSEVSVGPETVVESTEPEYEDIHSRKPIRVVKPPVLEANLWPNNVEASVEPQYDDIDSAKRTWLGKPFALKARPKMVEAPIAPLPSYSNVPVVNTPPVGAPKPPSPNHKTNLAALPPVIFSESISPSDFLCVGNPLEVREGMPPVFGAVYPILKSPCNTQPPVEISSDKVEEERWMGTGKFGEVVLAITKGLSLADMRLSETDTNRDISIYSVLKKLKPNPSTTEQEAFDKEVKFMSVLKHPNVVQFIGVCYQDPAFIIMEHMDEGDLNQFLQKYSEIVTAPSTNTQIAISTLAYMAFQIASAMKYLAALNFIHRDLASRNCFVGERFTIKLADIGRNDQYQTHYYRIRSNTHLPIRWMATECFYGKFSEKSDVWAFGVTMWELFTLAREHPYPHLSDEEVIHNALNMEYRQFPSRPTACPQHIYEIMKRCWLVDLRQRNTFSELHQSLQSYN